MFDYILSDIYIYQIIQIFYLYYLMTLTKSGHGNEGFLKIVHIA